VKSLIVHKELGPVVFLSSGTVMAIMDGSVWQLSCPSSAQILYCGGPRQVVAVSKTRSELIVDIFPGPRVSLLPLVHDIHSLIICGDKLIATGNSCLIPFSFDRLNHVQTSVVVFTVEQG